MSTGSSRLSIRMPCWQSAANLRTIRARLWCLRAECAASGRTGRSRTCAPHRCARESKKQSCSLPRPTPRPERPTNGWRFRQTCCRPSLGVRADMCRASQEVELGVTALRAAALRAQPVNFEPMPAHPKRILGGDLVEDFGDRPVLKFDKLSADAADEMIVLRIAVVVLVNFPPVGPCHAT